MLQKGKLYRLHVHVAKINVPNIKMYPAYATLHQNDLPNIFYLFHISDYPEGVKKLLFAE